MTPLIKKAEAPDTPAKNSAPAAKRPRRRCHDHRRKDMSRTPPPKVYHCLRIKEVVADVLGNVEPEQIQEDTALFESEGDTTGLELDSLDGIKLALALADEYGLDPAVEIDYAQVRTVRDIAAYLRDEVLAARNRDGQRA